MNQTVETSLEDLDHMTSMVEMRLKKLENVNPTISLGPVEQLRTLDGTF